MKEIGYYILERKVKHYYFSCCVIIGYNRHDSTIPMARGSGKGIFSLRPTWITLQKTTILGKPTENITKNKFRFIGPIT